VTGRVEYPLVRKDTTGSREVLEYLSLDRAAGQWGSCHGAIDASGE
jgi:hypothetical protein